MKPLLNVVLIDDDTTTNFLHRIVIRQSEVAVLQAEFEKPEQALKYFAELAGEEFPDVILLDINMPIMNGWEFLEQFPREKLGTTRIIMLTSSINPEDEVRANSIAHVSGYWSKPLSIELLQDLAANASD